MIYTYLYIMKMKLGWKILCFTMRTTYSWFMLAPNAFFEDLFDRMSKFNLILVKLIQCSANNPLLWSSSNRKLLKRYTDSVPYTNDDINQEEKNTLTRRGIIFSITNPIHAGLVAVVYRGSYKGKDVIIKIKE